MEVGYAKLVILASFFNQGANNENRLGQNKLCKN